MIKTSDMVIDKVKMGHNRIPAGSTLFARGEHYLYFEGDADGVLITISQTYDPKRFCVRLPKEAWINKVLFIPRLFRDAYHFQPGCSYERWTISRHQIYLKARRPIAASAIPRPQPLKILENKRNFKKVGEIELKSGQDSFYCEISKVLKGMIAAPGVATYDWEDKRMIRIEPGSCDGFMTYRESEHLYDRFLSALPIGKFSIRLDNVHAAPIPSYLQKQIGLVGKLFVYSIEGGGYIITPEDYTCDFTGEEIILAKEKEIPVVVKPETAEYKAEAGQLLKVLMDLEKETAAFKKRLTAAERKNEKLLEFIKKAVAADPNNLLLTGLAEGYGITI